MAQKTYYDIPTQVKFYDSEEGIGTRVGIAYHNYIICACYGGIFPLDDESIYILKELNWIDFSEYIDD